MKRLLALLVLAMFCSGVVQAADFGATVDQAKADYQAGKKVEAVEKDRKSVV